MYLFYFIFFGCVIFSTGTWQEIRWKKDNNFDFMKWAGVLSGVGLHDFTCIWVDNLSTHEKVNIKSVKFNASNFLNN